MEKELIMNIEEEIFKKTKSNTKSLLLYGFHKEKENYIYTQKLMNNTMKVEIKATLNGIVQGKIYDLDTKEEYTNFRVKNIIGDFANAVKEEYQNILKDIALHCFIKEHFIFEQSNRISSKIKEKYHINPEFLWQNFPGYGVFRNKKSNKWFAIIMNLDKSKLQKEKTEVVEVLNVKLNDRVKEYIQQEGIYPAYHLSKKNWVSIILDDTLTDDEVMKLIAISYDLSDIT